MIVMAEGRRLMRTARTLPPDAIETLVHDFQGLLQRVFEEHGGRVCVAEGDTVAAAFPSLRRAVTGAVAIQDAVARHSWPHGLDITVSVGIDQAVETCALICDIAESSQVFLSQSAATLLEDDDVRDLSVRDLGERPTRRTGDRVHVHELVSP